MARLTKKDIYKSFGIEYDGSGHILSPWGTWIPCLIPFNTNTKIGKAGTWSMHHGNEILKIDDAPKAVKAVMRTACVDSVKGSCPCHCDGCYCDSGNYNYGTVKASNIRKLLIAKLYTDFMVCAINAQIKADNIEQLRIHASGDFFNAEYINAWVRIASENPNVTFWTYTKNDTALEAFKTVPNVSIVPSITPMGINFGTCSELLEMHSALTAMGYRVHICACGTEFEKHCADCKTGCKAIGTECDFVLFIKHSTRDYKAGKKDPEAFEAVKAIIKAQDN